MRAWVHRQTGLELGYAEQLYTFGDRGRHAEPGDVGPHVVSIGYLALTQANPRSRCSTAAWRSWYQYFPWEDWRRGRPEILEATIEPRLREWAAASAAPLNGAAGEAVRSACACASRSTARRGTKRRCWSATSCSTRRASSRKRARWPRCGAPLGRTPAGSGVPMRFDHRRILATAIGRVRAKIKYRPVIFELMPDDFTLFELQRTVEAILGPHLHKQNFRRLVEGAGLVEPTGEVKMRTGGRPAKLYRFRREVLLERPAPGVRVKPGKV